MIRSPLCDYCGDACNEEGVSAVVIAGEVIGDACRDCVNRLIRNLRERQTESARVHYASQAKRSG